MSGDKTIVLTQQEFFRMRQAEALLRWYETTSGTRLDHDPKCNRWTECTCGWAAFIRASTVAKAAKAG